jgi:V/A-type H+/Na+-transporting ATPase subunit E
MMSNQVVKDETMSSGVDALIARLRDEGVSAGRAEASKIVKNAQAEAKRIFDKASVQARDQIESSRKEAKSYQTAGEEALKTAMRDAVLDMKSRLMERFSSDVERLVSLHLKEPDVLKQLILEVTAQVREDTNLGDKNELEILLPAEVVGLDELRQNPEELEKGLLTEFVRGLTGELLREGITFRALDDLTAGIHIQVKDNDIVLDLSDEAITALLLKHLQPRFRVILEGIVK